MTRWKSRPSSARSDAPEASSATRPSRSTATRWACVSASPTSRRAHSASRPPTRGSAAMAGAHPVDGERGVTDVAEHLAHQVARGRVEVRRRLAVEVARDAVSHVGLDQALQPVGGRGQVMKRVQRGDIGRHGLLRVDPEVAQVLAQLLEVGELAGGERRQGRPVAQVRRHPGVGRHPLEGGQLAVGQRPEQVDQPGPSRDRPRRRSSRRSRLEVTAQTITSHADADDCHGCAAAQHSGPSACRTIGAS